MIKLRRNSRSCSSELRSYPRSGARAESGRIPQRPESTDDYWRRPRRSLPHPVGGPGLTAHSRSESARQAQSDAQSLREKTKETETETATTRTKITEATNKKEAQAWCDGLTSAKADFDTLDRVARDYSSLTATRREVIGQICPQKKSFIEAYAKDTAQGALKAETTACSGGASSATISGSISITGANLAGASAYDVTVEVYLVPGSTTKGHQPVDKQTITVPAGGTGTLTSNVPLPSFDSGSCGIRAVSIWPSGV